MTRIVLLAVCGAIAGSGDSGGQRHTSTAGKFSIKMPGTPKESVQNVPTAVGNLPAQALTAEDWNRVVYAVTYFDFPPNFLQAGNVDAALEGSCAGMVANVNGKTLEKTNITLGSHPPSPPDSRD